jgi:hypothetical protein
MPFVPYATANDIADRFLELLAERGITPPAGTETETEFLSLTALLDIWRDAEGLQSMHDQPQIIRSAAAIHDLAAKVLAAESLPDFSSFEEHLKMIAEAKEFTTIGQIGLADARDDISRKMAELYVGCLAVHCGEQIVLDHPHRAKGDNPDILLTWEGCRWALAVKALVSKRNGQTIFERIKDAASQIDASSADCGMVIINAKNVIDHDAFWSPPQPFTNLDQAEAALRADLQSLIDLAAVDRLQEEWDMLFDGKTVPPIIFIGQSVTYLPLGGGLEAPTPVKAMVTDECNRSRDPIAMELAYWLKHGMQVILRGHPGPPPS